MYVPFSVDMQSSGSPTVSSPHIRMVQQTTPFYGHDPNVAGSGIIYNVI